MEPYLTQRAKPGDVIDLQDSDLRISIQSQMWMKPKDTIDYYLGKDGFGNFMSKLYDVQKAMAYSQFNMHKLVVIYRVWIPEIKSPRDGMAEFYQITVKAITENKDEPGKWEGVENWQFYQTEANKIYFPKLKVKEHISLDNILTSRERKYHDQNEAEIEKMIKQNGG